MAGALIPVGGAAYLIDDISRSEVFAEVYPQCPALFGAALPTRITPFTAYCSAAFDALMLQQPICTSNSHLYHWCLRGTGAGDDCSGARFARLGKGKPQRDGSPVPALAQLARGCPVHQPADPAVTRRVLTIILASEY